jgi:general secretion pathway protein D
MNPFSGSRRHHRGAEPQIRENNMKTLCLLTAATLISTAAFAAEGSSTPDKPRSVPTIEIQDLIAKVAKRTNTQYVVDPRARADVPLTGIDVDRLDYAKLLTILTVNGLTSYKQGDFVIVVPDANARQMPTHVYTDTSFKELDEEFVTVLLQAKNACTAHLVPILRPLMPQEAHMASDPYSNTMVISDRASNARRLADIFGRIDKSAPAGRGCQDWNPPSGQVPKKGS